MQEITKDAAARAPEEACGLLFGRGGAVSRAVPMRNAAADRCRRFEIDPRALFEAHRQTRAGDAPIVGCYHSHPNGRPAPSAVDAGNAHQLGWIWLIAAGAEVGAYRIVERGALYGRFDPVELHVEEDP